jgi:hypothetical protein
LTATVELCESNTVAETIEHNISNINYGNADVPNLVPATYPITAGENSYIKYIRLHVTAMGGSNKIDNIQIWKSAGAYVTGEDIQTNLETSAYTAESFATPVKTTYTHNAMPTADPTTANLGIAGSLSGSLTAAGYSDYWKSQLQTTGSTPAGNVNQKTFTIQYDEQ